MKSCIQIGRPSDNPVADSKIVCKSNIAHTELCLTKGDARVRKRGCLGATKRERPNMRTIKGISALLLAACSSIASAEGWQLHGFGDISVRNDYVTRSEEHTSELKSLMRLSYAVFCLKK